MAHELTNILLENFDIQLELQKGLQSKAQELRSFILKRELESITITANQMDEISAKVELIELERRQKIRDLQLPVKPNIPFEGLLRFVPDEEQKLLKEKRKSLKAEVQVTARINGSNRVILHEVLNSVDTTVKLIAGAAKPAAGYDYTGKSNDLNRRKLLNQLG